MIWALCTTEISMQELTQLSWLIGEWIHERVTRKDSHLSIHRSYEWILQSRFIRETVSIKVSNELAHTRAIIVMMGWDPIDGRIVTWTFTSNGRFAQGYMQRDGRDWICSTTGVRTSGRLPAATNTYRLIDDSTFAWQSTNRTVDGEPQPDILEHTYRRIVEP